MVYSSQSLAMEIPVYGKWCGPLYPASGRPPAVDEIDQACKVHDGAYGKRPGADADRVLASTVANILHRGSQWVRRETSSGNRVDYGVELTGWQFLVASAIVANFNQQQQFTVWFDVLDGDVRAVLKTTTSGFVRSAVVPSILTQALMTKALHELGDSGESLKPLLEVSEFPVELTLDAVEIAEMSMDGIVGTAGGFLEDVGDGVRDVLTESVEELPEVLEGGVREMGRTLEDVVKELGGLVGIRE